MKARLIENITYTFSFKEVEKANKCKESHFKQGFVVTGEHIPKSEDDTGFFTLVKETNFQKE